MRMPTMGRPFRGLSRGPEQRTDKKHLVSDLRESGSIEQGAVLHREDAHEK